MSESDGGPGRREVAYRMFAAEYDDADFEFSESDEERAPNYVITPTGARVNRLFVVGVLTEVESVSEDVLRARVVDPTGAFVCYAGQYQPDEQAFLERADPPLFVALTGKARTFQPDDADVIYTSLRPEAINEVDVETRDRWTLQAAEQTVDRVRTAAGALALDQRGDALEEVLLANDVEEGFAAGVPLAFDHYGTTMGYLASLGEVAIDAARLVAGEVDEIDAATLPPDAAVERDLPVVRREFDVPEALDAADEAAPEPATDDPMEPVGDDEGVPETVVDADPGPDGETDTGAESVSEGETDTGAESATEGMAEPGSESATGAETAPERSDHERSAAEGTDTGEPEPATTAATSESGVPDAGQDSLSEPSDEGVDEDEPGEVGDFEPGEFDLDDEEREEIESEYGTDFQSGTEVDEPGEAGIETPDLEAGAEADAVAEADASADAADGAEADPGVEIGTGGEADTGVDDPAAEPDAGVESDPGTATEPAAGAGPEDVALEDVAVEVMEDLDDGSGASRTDVVEATVERTGADEAAVEDAIQDALMDGRCFEPDDDTLQAI
jgi:RPA family protein